VAQVTDELRVLVAAEVDRAIRDLKQFDDSLKKSEKSAGDLGKALEKMEKSALVMSGVVVAAGGASIKFAAENEKLKASLEVLLGSAEQATTVFEEWKQFGSTTPLDVGEISSAGKALLAFGIDAEDVTVTLRRLGDVAQGIGAELGSVADVYGKVKVQGKASSMEINQLQRQGVPIVQALAKAIGTTEAGIKDMVSAGKIGFPEMEKAFQVLTEDGGKFEGMMDKLSQTTMGKFSSAMDNAEQAAASFGDLLLPMVNEVLDAADELFQGLINMDDGTKRFVLGMGGVIAVSGPVIMAIKGISTAMTAMMANPYILAIGGIIAGAAVVVGIINKQAHAYEDLKTQISNTRTEADRLLSAYADGNEAKILDKETTEELIKLYPEMTGKLKSYAMTAEEAAKEVAKLAYWQRVDLELKIRTPEIERVQGELARLNLSISDVQTTIREGYGSGEGLENLKTELAQMEALQQDYVQKIFALNKAAQDAAGPYPGDAASTISPVIPDFTPSPSDTIKQKKTWQDWYSEITKVDIKAITMRDQGEALGQLFIDGLTSTMTVNQNIAEVLGNEFDVAAALRSQRDEIERALRELLAISPSDIDDPFSFQDKFINPLADRFKILSEQIRGKDFEKEVKELRKKIDDFSKSEYQLAYEMAQVNGYTDEQAAVIARLTQDYALLGEEVRSLEDAIRNGLLKAFPELDKQAAACIASMAANLADVTFDGILDGLNRVGAAFAKGENSAASFRAAMADMAQSLLDMLPQMFLQAGLQLIIGGNWPLGLGFIAAAGSSALISGYTRGRIEKTREDAEANAHGNLYDMDGILRLAKGGAFTNQIVNAPTYFRHGGGLGLMGEAGPEAVIPLKRMANGDLGISANSGGAQVVVNIINNSSEPVQKNETTDSDGNVNLDVIVGGLVERHLASGKADRVLGARYGVRPVGV